MVKDIVEDTEPKLIFCDTSDNINELIKIVQNIKSKAVIVYINIIF